MPEKEFVCIVCPNSCRLTVQENQGELEVHGAGCRRGMEHGKQEYMDPKRMLTTTVAIQGGVHPRLSVVSNGEVPKEKLQECLDYIYGIQIEAPVVCKETIVKDICGTGVDILASRSMECKKGRK
jgi:CxxC motif-containing protein